MARKYAVPAGRLALARSGPGGIPHCRWSRHPPYLRWRTYAVPGRLALARTGRRPALAVAKVGPPPPYLRRRKYAARPRNLRWRRYAPCRLPSCAGESVVPASRTGPGGSTPARLRTCPGESTRAASVLALAKVRRAGRLVLARIGLAGVPRTCAGESTPARLRTYAGESNAPCRLPSCAGESRSCRRPYLPWRKDAGPPPYLRWRKYAVPADLRWRESAVPASRTCDGAEENRPCRRPALAMAKVRRPASVLAMAKVRALPAAELRGRKSVRRPP